MGPKYQPSSPACHNRFQPSNLLPTTSAPTPRPAAAATRVPPLQTDLTDHARTGSLLLLLAPTGCVHSLRHCVLPASRAPVPTLNLVPIYGLNYSRCPPSAAVASVLSVTAPPLFGSIHARGWSTQYPANRQLWLDRPSMPLACTLSVYPLPCPFRLHDIHSRTHLPCASAV